MYTIIKNLKWISLLLMVTFSFSNFQSAEWRLSPQAGALHVGPGGGDTWWGSSLDDVTSRACLFDDEYVFNADGTFQNVLGDQTWIESWQGFDGEGCGSPVAPHDGSNPATWSMDEEAGTLTVSGLGAYLGLAKAHNNGEDGSPVDNTITYNYTLSEDGHSMSVSVWFGWGEWTFQMATVESIEADPCADVTCGDWEECSEGSCVEIPNVDITFNLDMNGAETTNGVFVAGGAGFGWPGDYPMTDEDGDGVFSLTVTKAVNSSSNYTYLTCTDWGCKENIAGQDCADPNNYNDRFLSWGEENVTVNACFGLCGDGSCSDLTPPETVSVTFQVNMNGYDWDGNNLHATGSYEGWSGWGTPLADEDGDGIYTGTIEVIEGTQGIEYKYVIGGWGGPESGAELGSECDYNTEDGYNNYGFDVGTEDLVLPAYVFGGGCSTSFESDLIVTYNFAEDITGFQFDVEGVDILSASGGAAGEYFDLVQANATTIVGVSFSNTPIPAGSGVLTTLTVVGDASSASITNVTLTDVNAQEANSSVSGFEIFNLPLDCAGVPGGDSFLDCSGNCTSSSYLSWIGDGYCDDGAWGVDFITCDDFNLDDGDCNDDCGVPLGDNSSCADECGVPNGDNTSCSDCNGVPNGTAELDYCGVCDGPNTANECEEPACAYTVSMVDSYGDGWNGNILSIGESSYTIDAGASAEGCYEGPMDVAVSCGGGSYASEVSWTITDASGEVVLSGGAPFTGCLGDCGEVEVCEDTDNGATDPYGDGCAAYNSYPSWCGNYDDDDFASNEMCCICGGGSTGNASVATTSNSFTRDYTQFETKKEAHIAYQIEQQRRLDNPIALPEVTRDEDCGGSGPDIGCDGECFSGLVDDCSGECGGAALVDDCGECDGGNESCSGCTDSAANNWDIDAIVDNGTCEFAPAFEEEVSYDSTVDIDIPEVVLEDVEVNIDIPAGALDIPEGTEVTLEVSEASEAELQDIIDNSSSADAEIEVYQGISFDAIDENGETIELAEGATLDVELTFEPGRNEYDLGFIIDGEIVALGAECVDNGDGSYTCAGDGPGFGSYIVYSFDPESVISGCTLISACNFDSESTVNDGSCFFAVDYFDCDGNCLSDSDGDLVCDELEVYGCTDETASNYDSEATENNDSCEYGYSFTHELISGNNLISLPGYLNNPDSQDLMNSIVNGGTDVIFLLGQGLGLFNTIDGWSGNLTTIDPHSGYWINTADSYTWDILFEGGSVADCEIYETTSGNNLLSYKWGNGSSATLEALGGESFATNNFNFILGQGLGLFNTDNGWSGNLTNLEEGKGYWLNIKDQGVDEFRWGFDNCNSQGLGRTNSEIINPNELMHDEFKFVQSTEQAFYLIEELTIDGIEPSYDDVVLAYNGDVLIGSAFWTGSNTAVPAMGKDMSDATIGFAEYGDNIQFKLYIASSGELYELEGVKEGWSSLLVSSINKLTGTTIEIPQVLTVNPAFPNPFNPSTKLSFGLPKDGNVEVNIFDVNGRLVGSLVNSFMTAGSYEVEWNGIKNPSGMYLVKVQFENEIRTEKIMLVK